MDTLAKVLAGTAIMSPWTAAAIIDRLEGVSSGWETADSVIAAAAEMYAAGLPVSIGSIATHPKVRVKAEDLVAWATEAANPAFAQSTARLVRARAQARRISEGVLKAKSHLDDASRGMNEPSVEMGVAEAERIALEAFRGLHGEGPSKLRPEAEEVSSSLRAGKPSSRPVPTGFLDIDQILEGGLRPGELFLIAARPSVGKSTLALQMAGREAMVHGKTVLFFSMEMSRMSLVERLASAKTAVPMSRIRTRIMCTSDQELVEAALKEIGSSPLFVDQRAIQTPATVSSAARRLAKLDISCLILDYVQLMRPSKDRDSRSRTEEVGEATSSLKALAMELNIPVVALSQLSRAGDVRGDEEPRLSHLRDSGCLEQDADVVMFLHRRERHDRTIKAIVAKNRNGPLGSCNLLFQGEFCRFVNSTTKEQS